MSSSHTDSTVKSSRHQAIHVTHAISLPAPRLRHLFRRATAVGDAPTEGNARAAVLGFDATRNAVTVSG